MNEKSNDNNNNNNQSSSQLQMYNCVARNSQGDLYLNTNEQLLFTSQRIPTALQIITGSGYPGQPGQYFLEGQILLTTYRLYFLTFPSPSSSSSVSSTSASSSTSIPSSSSSDLYVSSANRISLQSFCIPLGCIANNSITIRESFTVTSILPTWMTNLFVDKTNASNTSKYIHCLVTPCDYHVLPSIADAYIYISTESLLHEFYYQLIAAITALQFVPISSPYYMEYFSPYNVLPISTSTSSNVRDPEQAELAVIPTAFISPLDPTYLYIIVDEDSLSQSQSNDPLQQPHINHHNDENSITTENNT
jgi:hypothetical protein